MKKTILITIFLMLFSVRVLAITQGPTTFTGNIQVNGAVNATTVNAKVTGPNVVQCTAPCTISTSNGLVQVTTAGTATLPPATGSNLNFDVENSSSGTVTVACNGSDTIDYFGASVGIVTNSSVLTFHDYGSGHWVVN